MSTTPPPSWPPYGPTQQHPVPPQTSPQPGPAQPRRRRTGLAAAVVATSLVVGGGAGVGGAALWDATHSDAPASASATAPSASQVSSSAPVTTDGSVESVAAQVSPSVVKIDVVGQQEAGSGSGIILTADGTILTNNHVVAVAAGGGSITVDLNDGTTAKATVLGTDPLTDTAVIKAEGVSDLKPATIGKSANVKVGQQVVAIGSPFGLDSTVTSGIISALNRPVNVGTQADGSSTTYPAIQTDAAINPGNSGGPLVDMNGAVIGINSSIRTAGSSSGFGQAESGSIGLGFAIPIDEVMPIVDQMSNGETPTHARLGIQVSDPQQAGTTGALVREVSNGSTADQGGLTPGDLITQVDDHRISNADSLVATIRSYRPGDSVTLTWQHDGAQKTGSFKLDSDATTS